MARIVDFGAKLFSITSILLLLTQFSTQRTIPKNSDCSFESQNYSLSWKFDEQSNDVVFRLATQSQFENNFYTSIAFGNEQSPKDVITVFVRSGQIGLMDGHLDADGAIESDEKTNVQSLQFDFEQGRLSSQFARPIETLDSEDVDLNNCVNLFVSTKTSEIIAGAPLELGSNLEKIEICDISATCNINLHTEVFKREEEAICASAPKKQKNRIEWTTEGDRVIFDIYQNGKKGKWWSAIGIGESMSDLNILMFFAENGRLKKHGIFRTEGKMQPQPLIIDGIELVKENVEMNEGKAHFKMSIKKDFLTSKADSDGCIPLQISILGGEYQPNFSIRKHHNTPESILVCNLNNCGDSTPAEQPNPTESQFATDEKTNENVIEDGSGEIIPNQEAKPEETDGSGMEEMGKDPETSEVIGDVSAPKEGSVEEESPLTDDENVQKPITTETEENPLPVIDRQSTNPSENTGNRVGCPEDHEDLKVCDSYFSEYLGKVNEWSERHSMKMTEHMWKACSLLSQVQHVTTMCCQIFRNTCAAHLNL